MIAASRSRNSLWLPCFSDEDAINQTLQLIEIFILSAGAGGMCQALRGILNGCGMQGVNARISMFSGYVIGLPLSALLCYGLTVDDTEFVAARGVFGLWVGLAASNIARLLGFMIVMARVDWNELSRKAQAKAKANKPSEEVQPLSAKNERTQSTYDLAPARGEEPTPRPSPEAQERERAIKDIIAEGELTHHHPLRLLSAMHGLPMAARAGLAPLLCRDPGLFGRRQSCRAGT